MHRPQVAEKMAPADEKVVVEVEVVVSTATVVVVGSGVASSPPPEHPAVTSSARAPIASRRCTGVTP